MGLNIRCEKLLKIIRDKEKKMITIKELTIKQKLYLVNNKTKDFFILIKEKQEIIDQVNDLDEQFENEYDMFKSNYDSKIDLKALGFSELKKIIENVQTLLLEIQELEYENNRLYNCFLKEIQSNIKKAIKPDINKLNAYQKYNKR